MNKRRTIEEVIKVICEKSVETESGCYEWQGGCSWNGYGRIFINGKKRWVHIVVYEYYNGPVSKGLELDHIKCDNRKCWNIEHLEPTTHRENTLRGVGPSAVNSRKIECIKGHPLSGDNLCIQLNGARVCRMCKRNALKLYREQGKCISLPRGFCR